jgi:alpha-tubulin suppressor-like RCC1 family protein/outer membrane protein OmpA-like peptidoglycan-associated protein
VKTSSSVNAQAVDLNDGLSATKVVTGYSHSCALSSGEVFCWGSNRSKQLGIGASDLTDVSYPVSVASVSGGFQNSGVTDLIAGLYSTCAIKSGFLYCWGSNSMGQLGDGTTTAAASPIKIPDVGGFTNSNIEKVAINGTHACAVRGATPTAADANDQIYCWGLSLSKRLGHETTATQGAVDVPKLVAASDGFLNDGTKAISGVALTDGGGCAIEGGVVYCWGTGSGELGPAPSGSPSSWAYLATAVPAGAISGGNTNIERIDANFRHVCVLKGGTIYCWGEGSSGMLGSVNPSVRGTAVKIADATGFTNTGVTSMSVGHANVCVVKGAELFCWGSRNDGMMMDGSVGQVSGDVTTATKMEDGEMGNSGLEVGADAVSIDYSSGCVTKSAKIYCWGTDSDGRLGLAGLPSFDEATQERVSHLPTLVLETSQPTVSAISPTSFGVGDKITITGTNFNTSTLVWVGEGSSSDAKSNICGSIVIRNSGTEIECTFASTTTQRPWLYVRNLRQLDADITFGSYTWTSSTGGGGGGPVGGGGGPVGGGGGGSPTLPTLTGTVEEVAGPGIKVTVPALASGARLSVLLEPSTFTPGPNNVDSPVDRLGEVGETSVIAPDFAWFGSDRKQTRSTRVAVGETYRVIYSQLIFSPFAFSATTTTTITITGNVAAATPAESPAVTTTTTVAPVATAVVPGVTVTDTKVYTKSVPKKVAAGSAIAVISPAQAKTRDIETLTPRVCLPANDDLVFIKTGRCVAQIVSEKTGKVLRRLTTRVVADEVSEINVGNEIVTLAPIYFGGASASVDAKAKKRLQSIKDRISAAGTVLLVGHSGILMGNTPENQEMGRARAIATRNELRDMGAKGPFFVTSAGALAPASTKMTQVAQAKNRRVVIVLIP